MKLKLAALLFSQAAAQAVQIDKSNYEEYLCGPEIFTPINVVTEKQPRYIIDSEVQSIIAVHDLGYCVEREKYRKAVIAESKKGISTTTPCFEEKRISITKKQCVEKTGMQYAYYCEELKKNKKLNPEAWNEAIPNLKECTSPIR
jgi:hypothetical protein